MARKSIFATTDAHKGALKTLSEKEGYVTFILPSDIGGRYSVQTAVGLFPLACAGIDPEEVLRGSAKAREDTSIPALMDNEAYKYAVARHVLYKEYGLSTEMLITYSPFLVQFGEWWKQLFGESEGKEDRGIYPTSATFTTDLHSLGQFVQQGTKSFFETVLHQKAYLKDVEIPYDEENLDGLNYLVGKNMAFINEKAFEGTLKAHHDELVSSGFSLKEAFASDPERVGRLSFDMDDLHFDLSKNLVDEKTLSLLCDLGRAVGLEERRDAMFAGEHINTTEDRAVLHTALRRPAEDAGSLVVDGQDCVADVREVLDRMYAFAERVRSGEWKGVTGKRIEHLVSIGIGGSDLGPVMVYEALKPYADAGIDCRYVSNIDPNDMAEKVKGLDPETTLVIIVSKTFTTLETLTNAREAKAWLLETLRAQGAIDGSAEQDAEAIRKHFVAVSTALDLVADFGIDPENAFGFWNWVGGRYSVDSAVGLSLIVAFGPERFECFLKGFHDLDRYFAETPLEQNVVALLGLLNVWYVNFWGAESHAVLPYNQYLHRFAAYLQQLTMESNGKSVRWDGSPVTSATGEIFWGEPGTNGQHAFYQLIHQGTRMIPADFIAFVNTPNPAKDGEQDVHELFLGNFLAQTKALAFGKTADEVRAEGTAEWMVPARCFDGNRPTTSIFGVDLTPHALGELIALYEHITFVEGTVWGLDSYDQWGVELGKQLAKQITPAFHDDEALAKQDASTQALINYYRTHRK